MVSGLQWALKALIQMVGVDIHQCRRSHFERDRDCSLLWVFAQVVSVYKRTRFLLFWINDCTEINLSLKPGVCFPATRWPKEWIDNLLVILNWLNLFFQYKLIFHCRFCCRFNVLQYNWIPIIWFYIYWPHRLHLPLAPLLRCYALQREPFVMSQAALADIPFSRFT